MEPRIRNLRIRFLMGQLRDAYDPADVAEALLRFSQGDHDHRFLFRLPHGYPGKALSDWPALRHHAIENKARPLRYGNG